MELQYIKTDKNGTKWYHDWTCRRCGGAGGSDSWLFTGRTCWDCGGTGKRYKPAVVKTYTPEYAAKLEAQRVARYEKKLEKAKAEGYIPALKKGGFGENGIGYVYTGDTYAIRNELRRGGARFNFFLHWVSPTPIAAYPCIEIHADEVIVWKPNGLRYDLDDTKCKKWAEAHGLK